MMCKFDQQILQKYIDGSIDPLEKIFADEHLQGCKVCRKEMTTLKLLFWELEEKSNFEVEIPSELDSLKDSILNQVLGEEDVSATKMVVNRQRKTMKATGKFLDYIPGVKESEKLIKESAKVAPIALGKASKSVWNSAKKLMAR